MQWKKDANVKYTDLCKFVDEHIDQITVPGANPELEEKIYNYIWLSVKAIAINKCMFNNFDDYDGYAFYTANRLFHTMRNSRINEGKTIKGKLIRPVKSVLNYFKAIRNPCKVEYQNLIFRTILDEQHTNEDFDSLAFKERLRANAADSQGVTEEFKAYLDEAFKDCGSIIDRVLDKSPFNRNTREYYRLKMSIMLNSIELLKTKRLFDTEPDTIILWKLPKSMSNYVRVLLKEFFTELKKEIIDCYSEAKLSDTDLDNIVNSGREEYDYEGSN